MIKVGIDKIGFYIPENYLKMTDLAEARDIDPDKFLIGIGQEEMAVPTKDMDIVSMGATAAQSILDDSDRANIEQIIVGTESSVDYSKAAATHIHELLEIQPYAKAYEVKQACYAGTAALQAACDYVRLRPEARVLVIASDISRYGLNTSGESTQGAGAIAMLVTANPRILSVDLESISLTENAYDFWRPFYSSEALVEGKYSTELYMECFAKIIDKFKEDKAEKLNRLEVMYFHLPFTKMGRKALNYIKEEKSLSEDILERWESHYDPMTRIGRRVGNTYTASLYMGFLSSLAYDETLAPGQEVGLFSYGSGAVAELLTGRLEAGAFDQNIRQRVESRLQERNLLDIASYEEIYQDRLPEEGVWQRGEEKRPKRGSFYLERIDGHARYYQWYE